MTAPAALSPSATGGGRISADDQARRQAIEAQQKSLQQNMQSLAHPVEPFGHPEVEKLKVECSVLGVAQGVNSSGSAAGKSERRLNYRGDLAFSLQAGSIGEATETVFGQLRFGQA